MLVRNGDFPRRTAALNKLFGPAVWNSQQNVPINGVTTLQLPAGTSVHQACEAVDAEVGQAGAGMPDHVIHVTPLSCCPATEPVPAGVGAVDPPERRRGRKPGRALWWSSWTPVVCPGRRTYTGGWAASRETREVGNTDHYRGHGTFVCGVLRTVAPNSKIDVNGKFFRHDGIVESELAGALREAITADDAAVISMSAGATTRVDGRPLP